jgi:arginase family enzyme
MRPGKIAVYGVPTAAATREPGLERASWVLRQEGLLGALRERGATVVHLSDLSLFQYRPDPDHPRERNVPVVACAVRTGADEMTRALDDGFAVLLGGDCTMGAAAAMGVSRKTGRPVGLVWLDADADLNTPETTLSGNLEGMALALALGRGSAEVTAVSAATARSTRARSGRSRSWGSRSSWPRCAGRASARLPRARCRWPPGTAPRWSCTSTSTCWSRPSCPPATT